MKLLREYIEILLERAVGINDLDDVYITIDSSAMDEYGVHIYYSDKSKKPIDHGGTPLGEMYIDPPASVETMHDIAGNVWMINFVRASKSWGPLLYDVAMEYATKEGDGLMADRDPVSDEAQNVWNHYRDYRPDVTGTNIDEVGEFSDPPALGMRWTKPATTLKKLKSMKKLLEK